MTEITRVPLQPIAKGSLSKMWLGVLAAVLAAVGIAWAALPVAVSVKTLIPGTGASPTLEDVALIKYKGTLPDGKVFDEQERAAFPLQGVVPGFTKALLQMQKGGKYKVLVPSSLAYGDKQAGPIPPNTDLTFEIELIDFRNRAEIEQQQAMMQQLQQQQNGGRGAPQPGAEGQMPGGPMPEGAMPEGAMPQGAGPAQ